MCFFKYGLKSFCPLELELINKQYKEVTHSNTNPKSVKSLTHSQQLPHVLCGARALIKGCFAPVLAVKGRLHGLLVQFLSVGYAVLMRPNKAETAVHGCHCPGDMAVCMPDCGLVFECVTCFDCLKGVTFVVDLSNVYQFP